MSEDIDPQSGCRLPLPRREELEVDGQQIYDSLADPNGGTLRGLRGPGGILLHSPELSRLARPLNRYLRHQAGLGGRVRELAILVTARELDSQFEWAAHEPEALREGISRDVIDIVKHRRDTSALGDGDAIVIELGRGIFGARKVASATFCPRIAAFRPTRAGRSRRSDGQLRRDGGTARRVRHAAGEGSAAASANALRWRCARRR